MAAKVTALHFGFNQLVGKCTRSQISLELPACRRHTRTVRVFQVRSNSTHSVPSAQLVAAVTRRGVEVRVEDVRTRQCVTK